MICNFKWREWVKELVRQFEVISSLNKSACERNKWNKCHIWIIMPMILVKMISHRVIIFHYFVWNWSKNIAKRIFARNDDFVGEFNKRGVNHLSTIPSFCNQPFEWHFITHENQIALVSGWNFQLVPSWISEAQTLSLSAQLVLRVNFRYLFSPNFTLIKFLLDKLNYVSRIIKALWSFVPRLRGSALNTHYIL